MVGADLVRGIVLVPVAIAGIAGALPLWGLVVAAAAEIELRPPGPSTLATPSGTEIPQATFRLTASHNAGALAAAVDGNPATRWLSGVDTGWTY